MGSREPHFVHFMSFPRWTGSAWYTTSQSGHLTSIMVVAPRASDDINIPFWDIEGRLAIIQPP
jgi:hypothetical protein